MFALATVLLPLSAADEELFRSQAEYVVLDVQVLSGERPVTGLRETDFHIWDEGHPQQIASFSYETTEIELLLLLDVSASTTTPRQAMLASASEAMSHLHFRDRVGLLVFNSEPFLVTPLTWDRTEIVRKLLELPAPAGATELNTSIRASVEYLKRNARPDARRAILILTDNVGRKTSTNQQVRNDLWEADAVLNAVLFRSGFTGGNADVRMLVEATGGEAITWRSGTLPMVDLFDRIRKRYLLLYRAPSSPPGSVRRIRVELSPASKARLRNLRIRARTGYISGKPGSEARKRLELVP